MSACDCDESVTLYHGDCLDVLPAISDVDLIVTSPPYNLGITTGGGFGHYKRYCEMAARRLSQEVLDFGGVA